jgi:tetratricopeptide (TPR) repeat protein
MKQSGRSRGNGRLAGTRVLADLAIPGRTAVLAPLALLAAFGAGACIPPLHTAAESYTVGMQAYERRDFPAAEPPLERAVVHYRLARAAPAQTADALQHLGRVKGALCKFDDAEELLLEAFELEQTAEPPTRAMHIAFELAHLYFDQGKYAQSIGPFERGLAIFQQQSLQGNDPIGLADQLDDYAFALRKIDAADRANTALETASLLRSQRQHSEAKLQPSHYGVLCGNSAADRTDWVTARVLYGLSVRNTFGERSGPHPQRTLLHNRFARAAAYTCRYEDADENFRLAYESCTDQRCSMLLWEAANAKRAEQAFDESGRLFEQAIRESERDGRPGVEPSRYAQMLDDYAELLDELGRPDPAQAAREKAAATRAAHPDSRPFRKPAPFPRSCAS